ncbi:hypothetical protein [Pseudomonas sp. FME51]|uniref:hypothetical protein n=1 Tax=Pseudomonas sp. FME51 TaxID=2742609 RepID=UPI001867D2AD|nr:hypothetical protein [Pseudomonas sp. FME51]
MIDPTDKQTAALPLDAPKRGRGRPSTGKAMTPAEKQKAYRERLKQRKYELGGAAIAGEEAFKELNETSRKLASVEGKNLYLEHQLRELQEKYEYLMSISERMIKEAVDELNEAKAEIERLTTTSPE